MRTTHHQELNKLVVLLNFSVLYILHSTLLVHVLSTVLRISTSYFINIYNLYIIYYYLYIYVLRRDDGHVLRKALEFVVKRKRKRGRHGDRKWRRRVRVLV